MPPPYRTMGSSPPSAASRSSWRRSLVVAPTAAAAVAVGSVTPWSRPRPMGEALRPSQSGLGDDPPVGGGSLEGLIVALVLVGVGLGKRDNGIVECLAGSQVGGDGDPVAGAGVGPGQGPAAQPAVDRHGLGNHLVGVDRTLPVTQLTDVEVPLHPVDALDLVPPEKDVTRSLHQMLSGNHPFALILVLTGTHEPSQHRFLRLL